MADGITTVSIEGLPPECTESEFSRWFLFAPGFEYSLIKGFSSVSHCQIGLALFKTLDDAEHAIRTLDCKQIWVDGEPSLLAVEMASEQLSPRSTLQIQGLPRNFSESAAKRFFDPIFTGIRWLKILPSVDGASSTCWIKFSSGKKALAATEALRDVDLGRNYSLQVRFAEQDINTIADLEQMLRYQYAPDTRRASGPRPSCAASVRHEGLAKPSSHVSTSQTNGTPPVVPSPWRQPSPQLSTLFSSGLPHASTEEEVEHFCASHFEGFERMKFSASAGSKGAMCWIKFSSVELAAIALKQIQTGNYALPSDPSRPMRADYAKNELDQQAPSKDAVSKCDTLFIGNLSSIVPEDEIRAVVETFPGFITLRHLNSGASKCMAFVQFDSVENCEYCIEGLAGKTLPSAPEHVLDIQFSKNSLDSGAPLIKRAKFAWGVDC